MRFIHLSDLHLGKRVNEFSMIEDQEYILTKIINVVDAEKPQALIIAGDVYDKSVPSVEAVRLFDDFLARAAGRGIGIFIVSGNHDSAERLAFGAGFMRRSGVYLSRVYDGDIRPVTLTDGYGDVDIFMLPFLKPAHVRRYFPDAEIESFTDAVRTAAAHMDVNPANRSVLISHQFVTGAARCESEELSVGGADNVDASVFDGFDYVALGHLHSPQSVSRETLRYCGAPLKYSFSELSHIKSATVIDLFEKGRTEIRAVPLRPRRDMREIKGRYLAVTARDSYKDTDTDDYIRVTLTDEEDIPDVIGKLRAIYPNIMRLDYDNERTRSNASVAGVEDVERRSPLELFETFYKAQNNREMSEDQRAFAAALVEEIWEGAL
jgi:exonuclease SbcD